MGGCMLVATFVLGVMMYDWSVSRIGPTSAPLLIKSAVSPSTRLLHRLVDVVIVSLPASKSPIRYNMSLANCERLRKSMRSCVVYAVDLSTPPAFAQDVAAKSSRVMKQYEVNLLHNEIGAMSSFLASSRKYSGFDEVSQGALLLLEDDAVLKDTFEDDLAVVLNSVRRVDKFVVNLFTTKCDSPMWDQLLYSRRLVTIRTTTELCDHVKSAENSGNQCHPVQRERVIRQFRAWGSWFHSWSYTVGVLYARTAIEAILSTGTPFEPMDIWLGYLSSGGVFQGHYTCPPLMSHGASKWNRTSEVVHRKG